MIQVVEKSVDWSDLLNVEYASKVAILVLAVWLHASNLVLTATTMPSAAAEIGGINLLHWTFSLYLAASIVAGASISLLVPRYGMRNSMQRVVILYIAGSAICALAPSMPVVLIGRVLQGLGGGGLMALVYIAQKRYFPNHFIPRIIACLSVTWMVAAFCGPMIDGAFSTWASWRLAYWAYGAQAMFLMLAIRYLLEADQIDATLKHDPLPLVRLALLASAIVFISSAGADYHAFYSPLLVLIGVSVLLLFVLCDRRAAPGRLLPLAASVPSSLLGSGVLVTFLISLRLMSFIIYGPVILMQLYDLSPFSAGLVVMSETFSWSISAILFAGMSAKNEPWVIRSGSALVLLGLCVQSQVLPHGPLWLLVAVVTLANLGFGMMWGFIIKRLIALAPEADKDRAASLPPIILQTGFAVGSALSGIIANGLGLGTDIDDQTMQRIAMWIFAGFIPLALIGNIFAWRFVRRA
jgi:MFS family permease